MENAGKNASPQKNDNKRSERNIRKVERRREERIERGITEEISKMVINKNSMGYEINKKQRKKLIYLYEEYIKNPKDEFIKDGSWDFVSPATHLYTDVVGNAIDWIYKIHMGKMTIKEAKEILEALKKEDEEED